MATAQPESETEVPETVDAQAALDSGIELFNRQEFYEAHEAWEPAWMVAELEDRACFQGLIQAAAAFFKLQQGLPSGTSKLLEKSLGHLRDLPAGYMRLDLATLIGTLETWKAEAERMDQQWRTNYDVEALPRLTFVEH